VPFEFRILIEISASGLAVTGLAIVAAVADQIRVGLDFILRSLRGRIEAFPCAKRASRVTGEPSR